MKLLILLFSIFLFNNSYGETLLISHEEACLKIEPSLFHKHQFSEVPNGINFRFKKNCVIGKIILPQQIEGKKYLVFDLQHIKNLDLFYYNKNKKLVRLKAGSKVKSSDRNNPYFRPTFSINTSSIKDKTLYFQVKNVGINLD